MFGYVCIFLGLVAASLSVSKKRYLCVLYAVGIGLEYAIYRLYVHYGILDSHWENFYLGIGLTDLSILALMTYCYHRDYILVYPLIFLMVCVNVIIPMEWVLMHSDSVHSVRIGTLQALNFALLLILFGRSDGFIRLLDKLRTRLLSHSFEPADNLLRVHSGEKISEKMERG